jgi:hypothetical protein
MKAVIKYDEVGFPVGIALQAETIEESTEMANWCRSGSATCIMSLEEGNAQLPTMLIEPCTR